MNLRNWNYFFRAGCVTVALSALCSVSAVFAEETLDEVTRTNIPDDLKVDGSLRVVGDSTLIGGAIVRGNGANINDITPFKKVVTPNVKIPTQPIITFPADECGTTRLRGNAAVNPHNILFVNEINPHKVTNPNFQGTKEWAEDDSAATCFSGNVGVMPCTDAAIGNGKLFVNEISAVRLVERKESGEVVIGCDGKPLMTCVADNDGVIAFGGNLAVAPDREFWANTITPVTATVSETTGCTVYSPDDSCEAMTHVSGNLRVRESHIWGQVDDVILTTNCTKVLKLTFDTAECCNATPGAYVKLDFVGTDTYCCYDVFYQQQHYLNVDGSCKIDCGVTKSAINCSVDPIQADYAEWCNNAVIKLSIDSTGSPTYSGCLHYEIVGCPNLESFEVCFDCEEV